MGCESSNEKRHLKNSAQKTVVQLSPTERAILDCKSCRDKIKRYIKNLEQKEQRSKLKVKELLRLKQRDRAKLYLKQSKLFSEQTKIADGQLDMINQQIANIESTSNMNECAEVLNRGLAEMQGNDIQLPNVPKEQIPQDTNENDIKNKNKVKNKVKNKNKVIVE